MNTESWKTVLEIVTAVASIATALSAIATFVTVFIARKQLQAAIEQKDVSIEQTKITIQQNQTQFEDSLGREYRELMNKIPIKVWLGKELTAKEHKEALSFFYYYFHLSNQQVIYRNRKRVSGEVWVSWQIGMKANMSLPAFDQAWQEIKNESEPTRFLYLKQLEETNFDTDPIDWKRKLLLTD